MVSRPIKYWIAAILAGFILVQVVIAIWLPEQISLYPDGAEYLNLANNLRAHGTYSVDGVTPTRIRQPLYPIFLAGMQILFGTSLLPIKFVQIGLMLLVAWGVWSIARRFLPASGAALALTLFCLYPPFLFYASDIGTEILALTGFIGFIVSMLATIQTLRARYAIAAGLALGIATLARPTTLLLPFAMLIPFLALFVHKRTAQAFGKWFLFVGVFAATLLPWSLRNYWTTGEFSPLSCEAGYHLYVTSLTGYGPHGENYMDVVPDDLKDELQQLIGDDYYIDCPASQRFTQAAMLSISADPLGYLAHVLPWDLVALSYVPATRPFEKGFFKVSWIPSVLLQGGVLTLRILQAALWVSGLIGLCKLWSRHRAEMLVLTLATLYFCAALVPVIPSSRYVLPILPLLLIGSAITSYPGIARLAENVFVRISHSAF